MFSALLGLVNTHTESGCPQVCEAVPGRQRGLTSQRIRRVSRRWSAQSPLVALLSLADLEASPQGQKHPLVPGHTSSHSPGPRKVLMGCPGGLDGAGCGWGGQSPHLGPAHAQPRHPYHGLREPPFLAVGELTSSRDTPPHVSLMARQPLQGQRCPETRPELCPRCLQACSKLRPARVSLGGGSPACDRGPGLPYFLCPLNTLTTGSRPHDVSACPPRFLASDTGVRFCEPPDAALPQ